jgi:hypothetical protein
MTRTTTVAALALVAVLAPEPAPGAPPNPTGRLSFWDSPKRGANLFNQVETRERLRAAREAGLEWVRLVPDKWTGAGR